VPKGIKKPKPAGTPDLTRGKHKGRGHGLTTPEREAIYQSYLALGNKSATARAMGVTPTTVYNVIKAIESTKDPKVIEGQKQAMADTLTERFYESTEQVLDSLTPEDLESGRIPIHNSKGELVGYTHYGPSLSQKAIAAGIFTDKLRVLRDYSRAIAEDNQTGKLLMPESIEQLITAIKHRVTNISVLKVDFREDNPDLATRLDALVEVEQADAPTEDNGRLDFRNQA